jgi:segregation and condensation protein B
MPDSTTPLPDLAALVQAYLFTEGGVLGIAKLADLTHTDQAHVRAALTVLEKRLEGTGLSLVQTEREATLAVAERESGHLRAQYAKDLERPIGDAGLEVLSILAYQGPSSRSHIDYIRGVNTSSTIRSLLGRGLIERIENPQDGREYIYHITTELLAHLGATSLQQLPEYATLSNEFKAFEQSIHDIHEATYEPTSTTIATEST